MHRQKVGMAIFTRRGIERLALVYSSNLASLSTSLGVVQVQIGLNRTVSWFLCLFIKGFISCLFNSSAHLVKDIIQPVLSC